MKDLIEELKSKGVQESCWKGKKRKDLESLCEQQAVELKEIRPKIIVGWCGKQKGCLQVCQERGLIDPANLRRYAIDGRKNNLGNNIPGTSLREQLKSCYAFANEETMLQTMGKAMGITIDRSPKCHAEVAGEGIEYSWGCQKQWYKSIPLKDRKGKVKFYAKVKESLLLDRLTLA